MKIQIMLRLLILCLCLPLLKGEEDITIDVILSGIDENIFAKTQVITSKMIVHGRRSSRTIELKSWIAGINKSFTEYLSPPREAGTKMLKNGNKLWTYSPQTDRVIQISGHIRISNNSGHFRILGTGNLGGINFTGAGDQ